MYWKFSSLLRREKVSVYKLNKVLGSRVSRNTLYNWYREMPESINLENLGLVLWALREITGKTFTANDIISYTLE